MIWPVASILFLFALAGLIIAASTLNEHRTVQGYDLIMILFSSSVASFAYGMEILSPGLGQKFSWIVVRYAALTIFSLSNLLFVFYFTHIPIRILSWRFLLWCLLPAVTLIFMATFPNNQLVYRSIWLDTSGIIPMVGKTVGPLYWIFTIYIICLLLFQIYLMLQGMARESTLNRRQSLIIILALTLAGATHLMYLAGIRVMGVLNPNLFTYFPGAVLILWGTKRYRLADIRPIARTLLLEQMQDGILVLDNSGNLIDTNPAAEKFLKFSRQARIGNTLKSVSLELAAMLRDLDPQKKVSTEVKLNGIPMQVTISALSLRRDDEDGILIILRDISDRVEAEELKEIEIKRQTAWGERQKIARTLHDSINQYLSSLVILAGSASLRLEQAKYEQLAPVINHISTSAHQASQELRALIKELQLESPANQGFDLLNALTERAELISSQAGLHFELELPESLDLSPNQQRELFYILLEALNNIVQHAHASTVSICLKMDESQFFAEIRDNGRGFNITHTREGGMGLANIRERTRQLDGTLSIETNPASGTCIRLTLPVSKLSSPAVKTR